MRITPTIHVVAFVVFSALAAPRLTLAQSFTLIQPAPGYEYTRAGGVSADGTRVVGWSENGPPGSPGFVWSTATGRYDFGLEPGIPAYSSASGISGDGSTIVGGSYAATPGAVRLGYRWSGPGTYQTLGAQAPYPWSGAQSANHDASVIVGGLSTPIAPGFALTQAARWTQATGFQALGYTRPGHFDSYAYAVSRDGSTIVGRSGTTVGEAFVWNESSGMRVLPPLPGSSESAATATNHDGSIIVGSAGPNYNFAMWRNGQVFDLGRLANMSSSGASAVSDDGSVVVGTSYGPGQFATIWTPSRGIERLVDYLAASGVVVPGGVNLVEATGISADGRTIVGTGNTTTQALGFVVTIPAPSIAYFVVLAGLLVARRRG